MTLIDLLKENHNDLTKFDLAVLADWATDQEHRVREQEWKRAYALLREGAHRLIKARVRARALQTEETL
jgi:hypothetical protein